MKFVVTVLEIHSADVFVEASSEEEAREKAAEYIEEVYLETEYLRTTDPEEWKVLPEPKIWRLSNEG